MMGRGVMIGEVICKIGVAGLPIDMQLFLFDSVLYPVESHVHGAGSALLDGVVDNA